MFLKYPRNSRLKGTKKKRPQGRKILDWGSVAWVYLLLRYPDT